VSYWVSRTIGIEGSFGYTPSRVEEREDSPQGFSQAVSATGSIMLINGRVLFRPARTNLHFIIGGGIVTRGGDLWNLLKDSQGTKLTSPGAVLGIGVRASVTPKFALNISAEGNFYSFDPTFGSGPIRPTDRSSADLLVSVGIPIALGH
jgi:hypothetical protein